MKESKGRMSDEEKTPKHSQDDIAESVEQSEPTPKRGKHSKPEETAEASLSLDKKDDGKKKVRLHNNE